MFSTVHSCSYEKQLCRGGGEPACCFVLSVLSVLNMFFFFVYYFCQFCFVCCIACRITSREGTRQRPDGGGTTVILLQARGTTYSCLCRSFVTTEFVSQESARTLGELDVCVFFTLNRYFYPSTSRTPSARADSSQRDTSSAHKNHDTEILHTNVASRVDKRRTCLLYTSPSPRDQA